jgi:hypothetical protein
VPIPHVPATPSVAAETVTSPHAPPPPTLRLQPQSESVALPGGDGGSGEGDGWQFFQPSAAHEVPAPFAAEAVKFLCVTDLLPPAVLSGDGFARFASALSASSSDGQHYVPLTSELLVSELEALHARVSLSVADVLSCGAATSTALSVELWNDGRFVNVVAHCVDRVSFEPTAVTLLVHYSGPPIVPDGSGRDAKLMRGCPRCNNREADERIMCAVSEALQVWKIDPSTISSVTSQSESLSCATSERTCGVKTHLTCVATLLARVMGEALQNHKDVIERASCALGTIAEELSAKFIDSNRWVHDCRIVLELLRRSSHQQLQQLTPLVFQPSDADIAVLTALSKLVGPATSVAESIACVSGHMSMSFSQALLENLVSVASKVSLGGDRAVPTIAAVRETAFFVAQELSNAASVLLADPAEISLLCSALDKVSNPEGTSLSLLLDRYDSAEVHTFLVEETRSRVGGPGSGMSAWWAARIGRYPVLEQAARRAISSPATAMPPARAVPRVGPAHPNRDMIVAMRRLGLCRLSDVSVPYIQTVVYLNANLDVFEASQTAATALAVAATAKNV